MRAASSGPGLALRVDPANSTAGGISTPGKVSRIIKTESGSSTRGAIRLPPGRPSHLTPPPTLQRLCSPDHFPVCDLIVDIRHSLDEHGSLPLAPPRLRSNALRVATFIEYGGPLQQLEGRDHARPCKHRPRRKPCLDLAERVEWTSAPRRSLKKRATS